MPANDYFTKTGWPSTGASGSSSDARAEIPLVETGFSLLPDLTTVASRVVHVNAGSTALITTSGFTFDGTTFTAPAIASSGALTVTSTSASALTVGRQGATDPVLKVNANTASVVTGISITGAAAAAGVAIAAISSGTNENVTFDAKGSGTIVFGGTSTGAITLTRATTMSAALTYGGVTLSNAVTGTGNMVLSASPTLSGTVGGALTFSGALILSAAGVALNVTNDTTIGGSLIASGSTHAIGVASTVGWVGLRVNMSLTSSGGSNFALGLDCDPSLTLATGDTNYAAKMGVAGGTITTQGQTETIGHVAALRVGEPNIVLGTGDSITVAASLYVVDAPTEGVTNAAIYSASGTNIFVGNTRVGSTAAPTVALDVAGAILGTSTSASALVVGANGATNPVLKVNANAVSVATGVSITGAAAAGNVTLAAISSGANEILIVDAKGSSELALAYNSTGDVSAYRRIHARLGLLVASGQTLTVTGATITGLTAASVAAGTFPAGSFSVATLAVTSGLTLTGATITGAPTWGSTQTLNTSGNAATVTTNANLTGPITSVGNATAVAAQTGTGSTFVMQASPTLTTPALGVATATSINKVAITAPATSATLTIADGATLTCSASASVSGTNTGDQTSVSGNAGTLTVADTTSATCYVGLWESASGSLAGKSDAGLTYAATTGILTATGFSGPLTGNVTGNCSGTAATVTTAAQPSITSVGTLTTLTVDDITINGNTISSAGASTLAITPTAGQAITFDGTVTLDAGVIAGATSITSTTFVGNLTGNASGTAATVTGAAQAAITSVGTLVTGTAVAMGTGAGTATVISVANINITAVGNTGIGEDNLITYSLPANSLSANGKALRITAWGTLANNANLKTLKLYFGAAIINAGLNMTVNIDGRWIVKGLVIRTGTSAQDYNSITSETTSGFGTAKHFGVTGTATEVETGAITIKCTGEATADNDIVQEGMIVEFLN